MSVARSCSWLAMVARTARPDQNAGGPGFFAHRLVSTRRARQLPYAHRRAADRDGSSAREEPPPALPEPPQPDGSPVPAAQVAVAAALRAPRASWCAVATGEIRRDWDVCARGDRRWGREAGAAGVLIWAEPCAPSSTRARSRTLMPWARIRDFQTEARADRGPGRAPRSQGARPALHRSPAIFERLLGPKSYDR